jgi:hypothetical protein
MATSGRYQSKLLSFFSEQSLRLRDKTTETWRKVKIAAAWSTQIVLYPIYLAFQSTRLVGKQLRQTARQVLPQLRAAKQAIQNPDLSAQSPATIALSSDTPIQNTLQAAINLTQSLPASDYPTSKGDSRFAPTSPLIQIAPPHASLPPLQGIASLLDTRSLVLVSADYQLLDILTSEQQAQLYRRMIWELADYYHQQKALGLQQPARLKALVVNNFLPLPVDRPNALLPIRVFYGLMAWVQTSPVAIAANLFQESQLASLHAAEISGSQSVQDVPQLQSASGGALRSAELPWLSLKEIFQGLGDRTTSQKASFQKDSPQEPSLPLLTRFVNWLKPGALDRIQPGANRSITASHSQLKNSRPDRLSQEAQQYPWLTIEDLFGKIRTFQTQSNPSEDWELYDTAHANRLIRHQASPLKTADPSQPFSVPPTPSTATLSKVDNIAPVENDLALSITTIEAEVSLVTYVKHPLEQVLEWLDRGMLWIEERIAKVWEWWRDRLKGRK